MTQRMSPQAQVRLGKVMQLIGILGLLTALLGVFAVATDFIEGVDLDVTPAFYALILIYAMGLSGLGERQVKKGRARQAETKKAQEEVAERAAAAAAVEQGPEVCRTGGAHIFLGADTTCFNGCGTTIRDQVQA